ncbi:S-adenosyl-L-methionine-dependent methyltransferase [Acaromyces ingoldii]|uniref:S-adenosyl-L-methionine-dependent methyltransferase n=1 Tax=Acaromyces ingoldii TaxID=215250 RepID=A0A316YJE4_9BASI|nr:S-adenosyl-L-methionine-dependent methyltransferase [Acaromyces ingoldii]PWN89312.1 S-adenosyl-L-methionine-dependent methyltransferase [Acaromyces ingoldii]
MSTTARASASPPPNPEAKRPRLGNGPRNGESPKRFNGPAAGAGAGAEAGSSAKAAKMEAKRTAHRLKMKRKDRERTLAKTGEEPIAYDILEMLGAEKVQSILAAGAAKEFEDKFSKGTELELVIERLSSHGDGLAKAASGDWVVAVPRCLPGETVRAKVFGNERLHSKADLVEIVKPAAESSSAPIKRQDELVRCKYFSSCSGCQYQMLSYDTQLAIKQNVVRRAFANFAKLDPLLIPDTLPTIPSPLQYSYRTKLTPHFEIPFEIRQERRRTRGKETPTSFFSDDVDVAVGFGRLGGKDVLDIEECSIATATINGALPAERQKVKCAIKSYKNGATVLLRDSLRSFESLAEDKTTENGAQYDTEVVTNHKAGVKERVNDTKFDSPAGAFFQNNRSILPSLLGYVREQIILHSTPTPTADTAAAESDQEKASRYLVDAYCGSGLFSLCLADLFEQVSGVEISQDSIKYAKTNAELNGITNAQFLAGNAEDIFAKIAYPSDKTTVIIDPPRRGCDEAFIRQLLELDPWLIVYVSCNVHTQARDVGQIVRGRSADGQERRYDVLSVRGADLFPQTHHVEGVCVLKRRQ